MLGSRHVRRLLMRAGATFLGAVALTLTGAYVYGGTFALNVLLQRNVMIWATVAPDDPRLSAAMRLALSDRSIAATPGAFDWQTIGPGFDVAELPVIANGAEVDRISLARVDADRFRFVVRNDPAGTRDLDKWMSALGAVLVINGSYYTRNGTPDTPLVSAGVMSGPRHYVASHGAFAASPASARIHDLSGADWHAALRGVDDAMVSFPLLVSTDAGNRVNADWRWLANRSFVGQDRAGRIIFGTTRDAFFSLERLAKFLRAAPLDLAVALNLDGGPVASQGVALGGFHRHTCGQWELAVHDGALKLLTPLLRPRTRCWEMPIVLAVLPK
ncbi:MAG TPA: phosphodiester glycosidase family protein [Xanthobacteraceae bacterium]